MSRLVIYRLDVRAKQPIVESEAECEECGYDTPTLERATDSKYKRDIEKAIIACLRRFELDTDVELMDFSVEDE